MLRRRFMMQSKKSSSGYNCKFKLYYGGKTDQYIVSDGGNNLTQSTARYYGIGFTIIAGTMGASTVSNTTSGYHINYANLGDIDTSLDELHIKITKPDSTVVEYVGYLKVSGQPNVSISNAIGLGGGFMLIDSSTTVSIDLSSQYKWVSSPPITAVSNSDKGIAELFFTASSGMGTGNSGYEQKVFETLEQGTYTFEITYLTNADLSSYNLYVCNVGSYSYYTSNKSTYWNYFASLCKEQFIQTDGVFVDNMYKSNGSI